MFYFYRLNPLELGVGFTVPNGYIKYREDEEPKELIDALEVEKQKEKLKVKLAEAEKYLRATDFYYARFQETGEEVPGEVKSKRLESREFIRANSNES